MIEDVIHNVWDSPVLLAIIVIIGQIIQGRLNRRNTQTATEQTGLALASADQKLDEIHVKVNSNLDQQKALVAQQKIVIAALQAKLDALGVDHE